MRHCWAEYTSEVRCLGTIRGRGLTLMTPSISQREEPTAIGNSCLWNTLHALSFRLLVCSQDFGVRFWLMPWIQDLKIQPQCRSHQLSTLSSGSNPSTTHWCSLIIRGLSLKIQSQECWQFETPSSYPYALRSILILTKSKSKEFISASCSMS